MTATAHPTFRDAHRPVDERVADLLARMTLPEKLAQLGSAWVFQLVGGTTLTDQAPALLADGLGHVTRISGASSASPADAAAAANAIQRFLVEHTRLGIPAIVHEEVCAGLMARAATVFPQPIGLACTWDPSLVEEMAGVVRREMRAVGAHQGLSPVLDVCRDPRWGRIEETFGEDPQLVAEFGMAFVRGLQGPRLDEGVVATAKHFVGYGASEGGLNWAPAHLPPRELREVYLSPFEAAVQGAGLRSVMNAYNEIDGVPCGADHDLLTGVLRGEWGFEGTVVADYFSVRQLESYHGLATDGAEAAAMALHAGIDVELPMTDCYGGPLLGAVQAGVVPEAVVDRAVAWVLRTKFELGLFEQPYVDEAAAPTAVGAASSRALARTIAERSLVLLRNDGLLPLDPGTATIAVIGPGAADPRLVFGDYSYVAHVETLLEMRDSDNVFHVPLPEGFELDRDVLGATTLHGAIAAAFPRATVTTAPGCDVNGASREGIADAVALAAAADVVVLVVGDRSGLTLEATSGESRDRSSLTLPGVQEDLAHAVLDTGTPVVMVLLAGRPCGSAAVHERCAAVLAAWLPGDEGPVAVASVLAGAVAPGGKLALSYPRSAGHLPVYYRHKISGGRSHWKGDYVDAPVTPLYPFGHGLSYTSFRVAAGAPRPAAVTPDGDVELDVTVTNTGDRDGDEVVQVYTRDPRASVTRPVRELKAFCRVSVPAGEQRGVRFRLPVALLGFHDRALRYVVEPGEIEVHVGTSVTDLVHAGSVTIHTDDGTAEVARAFAADVQQAATAAEEEMS